MLSTSELNSIVTARLEDAAILLAHGRYDSAAYLCGYAVEMALKLRIVKTLDWRGFPSDAKEFGGLQSFKTHDLDLLLHLSGWENIINSMKLLPEWAIVERWNPESRYKPSGGVTEVEAEKMMECTRRIVEALR